MNLLKECLKTKRQLDKIDEQITELRSAIYSPKSQIITGMPRSGSNENAIERYIIRLEKLQKRKKELLIKQKKQWKLAMKKIGEISLEEKHLLSLRCVEGKPWKECASTMNDIYGKWGISRCFRVYGKFNKIL